MFGLFFDKLAFFPPVTYPKGRGQDNSRAIGEVPADAVCEHALAADSPARRPVTHAHRKL